ncbi:hypothetical protein GQ600_24037 [Phytophthora cactorum]|nr:hypothetical protein GQ600_24037 [Phytophthora cactorum]
MYSAFAGPKTKSFETSFYSPSCRTILEDKCPCVIKYGEKRQATPTRVRRFGTRSGVMARPSQRTSAR